MAVKEFTVHLNTPHKIRVDVQTGILSGYLSLTVDNRELMKTELTSLSIAIDESYNFVLDGRECQLSYWVAAGWIHYNVYIDGEKVT